MAAGVEAVCHIFRAHAVGISALPASSSAGASAPSLLRRVHAASEAATAACRAQLFLRANVRRPLEGIPDLMPLVLHTVTGGSSSGEPHASRLHAGAFKSGSSSRRGRMGAAPLEGRADHDRQLLLDYEAWLAKTVLAEAIGRRLQGDAPSGEDALRMAAAAGDEAAAAMLDDVDDDGSSTPYLLVPFVDVWSSVHSFARHQRGVATDSGGFTIRPLPGAYCPASRLTQTARVEVLRWLHLPMPDDDDAHLAAAATTGRQWRHALRSAVDVGCGSGMLTDLLLKARVGAVVAVDVAARSVAATRATVHEHFSSKRSPPAARRHDGQQQPKRFVAGQSPLVPTRLVATAPTDRRKTDTTPSVAQQLRDAEAQCGIVSDHRGAMRAAMANESAAHRRRQQFRLARGPHANAEDEEEEEGTRRVLDAARAGGGGGDDGEMGDTELARFMSGTAAASSPGCAHVDLVCFHPPTPYLDPSTHLVTPVSASALPSARHYHSRAMHRDLVQALTVGGSGEEEAKNHASGAEFVACVLPLPMAFVPSMPTAEGDAASSLHIVDGPSTPASSSSGTAAAHVSLLEAGLLHGGRYDVVHRRRFAVSPAEAEALAAQALGAAAPEVPLLLGQLLRVHPSALSPPVDAALATKQLYRQLTQELTAWYRAAGLETVVFRRRRPAAAGRTATVDGGGAATTPRRSPMPAVQFDDSFEHDNYLPSKSLRTTAMPDHWTAAAGPSFSYLADDFTDADNGGRRGEGAAVPAAPYYASPAERDVAARRVRAAAAQQPVAGRPRHSPVVQYDQSAHASFAAVFSAEAKAQRRGKVRKLALQSHAKHHWFLDEKLLKSHAAEVSLANEMARLEVREPE